MKERPILFSGPMVRALLAGTKTQTRRILKLKWGFDFAERDDGTLWPWAEHPDCDDDVWMPCPQGEIGDRLWVRETFYAWGRWETRFSSKKGRDEWHFVDMTLECGKAYQYDGDRPQPLAGNRDGGTSSKWFKRPAIHMPRAASRIQLDITALRAERLQDISEEDAKAEGAPGYEEGLDAPPPDSDHEWSYRASFQRLWEQINGPGSWAKNPYVWVVEFKRVQQASSGRPLHLEDAPCSA